MVDIQEPITSDPSEKKSSILEYYIVIFHLEMP